MKKLFISQPMRDLSNEEIIKVREDLVNKAKTLLGEDVEVLDSFFKDAPHDANPLYYLSQSIEKLSQADVAIFGEGYNEYRGSSIEYECAVKYGIDVIVPPHDTLISKSVE